KLSHYGLILKSVGDAVLLSSIKMAFRLHSTHVEVKIREQLLRESEEKFSKSFHLTPLSMAISLASDRRYIEINDAFLTLTGYSKEEVIGRNSRELGLWTDAETKTHVNHEIATTGEAQNVPIKLRTKSGKIRDAIYSAATVSLGGAPHVVAQVLDISERTQAEEANRVLLSTVQEEKTKLSGLIDSITDEVWFADTQGRFTLVNPSALREFALSPAETVKVKELAESLEVFRPDGSPRPVEEAPPLRALAGEVVRNLEEIVRIPASGELQHRQVSSTPVRDGTGSIIGAVSVVRDITERIRAEESLRKSEQQFHSLYTHMSEGLVVHRLIYDDRGVPEDYVIIETNPAFDTQLGICGDSVIGKTSREAYGVAEPPYLDLYARVALTGKSESFETYFPPLAKHFAISAFSPRQGFFATIFEDITTRKQVDEALRTSEEKYRVLVENANEAIIVTQDGVMKFANPRASELVVYSLEEGINKPFGEFIHPDDRALVAERYRKRLGGDVSAVVYPFRMIHKNGSIRWVEINSVLIAWEDRPAIMSFLRDITGSKRAEEALQESEERFRTLYENSTIGLYRTTPDGRIQLANPTLVEMLGYSSFDDLSTRNLETNGFEPSYRRAHFIETVERDGEVKGLESAWKRINGTFIFVRESACAVRDPQGRTLYYDGTVEDITERKQVEEALRESEERYRTMMEQAADAVIMHDETGRILDVNRRACQSLGYSREELLAMFIADIDPDAIQTEKYELWGKVLAGEQFTFESRQLRKDGSIIPVEVTLGSVRLAHGPAILGLIRDISERKQLEERIRQVRGDLLFAVSHDLKLPLQALNQSQEMLNMLEPGKALARFQEYREIWRRNLQRLERMINNLLDSQHGEEDRFPLLLAPCRLEEMVKRAVGDLAGYALSLQVSFDLTLQPVPEISCDENAIARVVENLLTNAVKFSKKGGRVEIGLGMEGEALRLEVKDQGCGIPEAEQAQLFQPFQRGSSAQQKGIPGTGLGLYVCRRIIEEHSGSISLRSTEGAGTTVTVTLPLEK
ncbi:MAG: PAS domain S-box protein, partial [Coprothermobacterota bacterium]|nr:PAS domain S-box protein [Coprothermobacterota bacterium]